MYYDDQKKSYNMQKKHFEGPQRSRIGFEPTSVSGLFQSQLSPKDHETIQEQKVNIILQIIDG